MPMGMQLGLVMIVVGLRLAAILFAVAGDAGGPA
jgi:hypothetical protein